MKESEREGEGFELVHDSVSCLCCVTSNFSTTEIIFLTPEAQKKNFFSKNPKYQSLEVHQKVLQTTSPQMWRKQVTLLLYKQCFESKTLRYKLALPIELNNRLIAHNHPDILRTSEY